MKARLTTANESRGRDGSPTKRLADSGFDHGVFVPFIYMFPSPTIPIIEVSMDSDFSPSKEFEIGKALDSLRNEILILAGGLTVHTFQDRSAFNPDTAKLEYHSWESSIHDAILSHPTPEGRKKALFDLINHKMYRTAHPNPDHFVPLYVAAGAGDRGEARIITGLYSAPCIAFGV